MEPHRAKLRSVQKLAEVVFGNSHAAQAWLSTPNTALGGCKPIDLCVTAQGAQHVRRVLRAIEFGGVV
ncbi:hypothetical protein CR159_18630 [Pollutimonas subterranea]|uniref:Antitoxin Xre/MbcA/ParS-like toxin-binding domain-containing protein n=1 Tax=Pollutimonas subterranea TaxID=2045210 RepID=A0A2N4U006_9BURK|nr:hypothetical protein CR159_18630 [Pollutimonas subterranea]